MKYSDFCKTALEFLQSKYGDAYSFKIDCVYERSDQWRPTCELSIKISPSYTIRITDDYLYHLYNLYETKVCNITLNLYLWQVKLIEIVEG